MYDLNLLDPKEKDQLLQELLSKYENEVSTQRLDQTEVPGGAGPEHPDEAADLAMLEPFAKVLEILIDKVEQLEERLEANERMVIDDLFGGIDKMYKQNLRTKAVGGLRDKYGDMFAPHMDALSELAPGEDIYEALHDMLDPMRAGEGWDDEKELGTVKDVAQSIADKIAKIKGAPVDVEVQKAEASAEPEKKEESKPQDAQAAFLEKVKSMRQKAPKGF
jgi:hypothetical protein